MNLPSRIDRSLKVLIRRAYPAFFRLARLDVDPGSIHPDDVTINLPEHRADQVFLVGAADDPNRWGLHLEYQLQPDRRRMPGWLLKNAAFNAQLGCPVPLVVVYLTREGRKVFPSSYTIRAGPIQNRHFFETIRMWEHADRIRDGELAELAPVLVLCEDTPSEATLRRERELILGLDVPRPVRADLLAVATMVGTRYFSRELLYSLFREEMEMLKEATFVEEWIQEGEARGARQVLLRVLSGRFGELPPGVLAHIEQADPRECERLAERAVRAQSLEDLGIMASSE